VAALPAEAVQASLGCGNPLLLAALREGETVLDLGSGGGIDVLLSARRVGPRGHAYGVDMTDEMLALARENQRKAGVENATFLRGTIEAIPLPEAAVDVVISNCVVNLSTDKARTIAEAFRVLRPGGRFAVADIVTTRPMPPAARRAAALWAGCVAGALPIDEYRAVLEGAGFEHVEIEPLHDLGREAAQDEGCCGTKSIAPELAEWDGQVLSAFVRAVKPAKTA
jgi:SAM-dependent methyltransferase